MQVIHYNIPAVTNAFLRVACRSHNFKSYSIDPRRVTCKNCRKTQVYRDAMQRWEGRK